MFDKIRKIFAGEPKLDAANEQDDARICAIALLVEAALADGIYADIEQEKILEVIEHSFGVIGEAATKMLDTAEERAEMAVDHYAFTSIIKKSLPKAERIALIGHLWDVTFADGEESPFEDALIRRVAALLAVTDHERAAAKTASLDRSNKD
jgi:uncharacterized tellurite resistance protein B-like protein